MNGFLKILDALKAGSSLANAGTWANRKAATDAVLAVLLGATAVAGMFGIRPDIDMEAMASVAAGVASAYGVLSAFFGVAANPSAGIQPKELQAQAEPEPAGADNGAGSAGSDSPRAPAAHSLPTDGGL